MSSIDPAGLASWITVDRFLWIGYFHAYIQFNTSNCNGQTTFGFWPDTNSNAKCLERGSGSGYGSWGSSSNSSSVGSAWSSGKTPSAPGLIKFPDPDAGQGDADYTNDTPEFEAALCSCIQQSLKNPPHYCFGKYVCGSWVAEMWKCAENKINPPKKRNTGMIGSEERFERFPSDFIESSQDKIHEILAHVALVHSFAVYSGSWKAVFPHESGL